MKGQSHPLCAAVTADSLRKGFDVGMEEPLGESDVTGLLMHPTAGLLTFHYPRIRIIFAAG